MIMNWETEYQGQDKEIICGFRMKQKPTES